MRKQKRLALLATSVLTAFVSATPSDQHTTNVAQDWQSDAGPFFGFQNLEALEEALQHIPLTNTPNFSYDPYEESSSSNTSNSGQSLIPEYRRGRPQADWSSNVQSGSMSFTPEAWHFSRGDVLETPHGGSIQDPDLYISGSSTEQLVAAQDLDAFHGSNSGHQQDESLVQSLYEISGGSASIRNTDENKSGSRLPRTISTKKTETKVSSYWLWLKKNNKDKSRALLHLVSSLAKIRVSTAEYRLQARLTKKLAEDLLSGDYETEYRAARIFDFSYPGDLFTETEKDILFDCYMRKVNGTKYVTPQKVLQAAKEYISKDDQQWIHSVIFKTPEDYQRITEMLKEAYRLFNERRHEMYDKRFKNGACQKQT